jgi:hypothetical protein
MSGKQLDFSEELGRPGLPEAAVAINGRVWYQDLHGVRAVFVDQTPFYTYPLEDETQHRFCALQLVESELALAKEVCDAFDVHPRNFTRIRKRFQQGGIAALVLQKPGRKSERIPEIVEAVVQLYQQGDNTYQVAAKVGRSPSTVGRILKDQGVPLRSSSQSQQPLFDQPEQDVEESEVIDQPDDSSENTFHTEFETASVAVQVIDQPERVAEETTNENKCVEPSAVVSSTMNPSTVATMELSTVEPNPLAVEATSIPYASPLDRLFTTMGLIEEASVEFQSADSVPHAGALLGLALLEETHLVEEARRVYGRLNNGWYGLRSLLWTLVIMALLRIKRPEQLKHHDPAGFGQVLGLPRAAEVKTVRRKLSEIAARGKAAELHRRLARRRAAERSSQLATLYVDGHVRAYHGKHRVGKTHISRLKRVMRAETDYWVQPAGSPPLLVVHDSVDASFHEALRDQVLPEIRSLVGERRLRIVFDREGWSRELFADLLEQGFDFSTYRKGSYEPLDESLFQEVTFQPAGLSPVTNAATNALTYQLAETTFEQDGWPRLRLIAVKKKNGGQTHLVSTGRVTWEALGRELGAADLSAAETAWCMFGRWSQENWFKYARTEYALDVLVDYSVEADDPERLVVNPAWRELDKQVKSAYGHLQRAQAKYARLALKAESTQAKTDKVKSGQTTQMQSADVPEACQTDCACAACQQRSQALVVEQCQSQWESLCRQRSTTPRKVTLVEASDRDDVKLSYERKLFTDTLKLSAYEIETRLYGLLPEEFRRVTLEGRSLIQEMLQVSGSLRVTGTTLEVHLCQLSAPRYTQALQRICERLNALTPKLPETPYRLQFTVKPRPVGE